MGCHGGLHRSACTYTTRRQHLLPRSVLRIGADAITPSTTVRDLGIFIDADLSMRSHVNGLSPAASLFCGNFVASDDQFHRLFSDAGRRPCAVQAGLR